VERLAVFAQERGIADVLPSEAAFAMQQVIRHRAQRNVGSADGVPIQELLEMWSSVRHRLHYLPRLDAAGVERSSTIRSMRSVLSNRLKVRVGVQHCSSLCLLCFFVCCCADYMCHRGVHRPCRTMSQAIGTLPQPYFPARARHL